MRVTLCTCADFASPGQGGKLNLMGIFDKLMIGEMPGHHDSMFFVVRVLFEYADSEKQTDVKVQMRGPDGEIVIDLAGRAGVGTMSPGSFATRNLVFHLRNVPFKRSGTYTFHVEIGDRREVELPLEVVQGAAPA